MDFGKTPKRPVTDGAFVLIAHEVERELGLARPVSRLIRWCRGNGHAQHVAMKSDFCRYPYEFARLLEVVVHACIYRAGTGEPADPSVFTREKRSLRYGTT